MRDGAADYLLFVDREAVGSVEAKKLGHTLIGVEEQSAKYGAGLPAGVRANRTPLPFAYETTGVETRFTCLLDPEPRSRPVFTFHRPETLADWLEECPPDAAEGENLTLRARCCACRRWRSRGCATARWRRWRTSNARSRRTGRAPWCRWRLAAARPTPRSPRSTGCCGTAGRRRSCSWWTATTWGSRPRTSSPSTWCRGMDASSPSYTRCSGSGGIASRARRASASPPSSGSTRSCPGDRRTRRSRRGARSSSWTARSRPSRRKSATTRACRSSCSTRS